MKVERVEKVVWQTSDGKEHATELDAKIYAVLCELTDNLNRDAAYESLTVFDIFETQEYMMKNRVAIETLFRLKDAQQVEQTRRQVTGDVDD